MFFIHRVEFDLKQKLQLIRLHFPIDDRPQSSAQQRDRMMIFQERGILRKNGTRLRIHHVLFQRDHSVAPAEHEKFVERFEKFFVSGPAIRAAFQRADRSLHHVDQDFFRRHDDERAERGPADHDEFSRLNQRKDISARHGEPAQHGSRYDDGADDDNHCSEPLNLWRFVLLQE
jgi:hypothetical protein